MRLSSVSLDNFRNYDQAIFKFGENKNFIIGQNAQGKSNLLEAIYLLCLSKSFRTSREKEAIKFSELSFIIEGECDLDDGTRKRVIFRYSKEKGKEISVNRKRLHKISDLIGHFPVVLSSPEEYNITTGPPSERRKFADILISQINRKYVHDLIEYQRIIKQKNAILSQRKNAEVKRKQLLQPWNERLIETGTRIINFREQFSIQLSNLLGDIYAKLITNSEHLEFSYKPNIDYKSEGDIRSQFDHHLKKYVVTEINLGYSIVGPHRDNYSFKINGKNIRQYGSRGQHKTVLISLAIAEYNLIKEIKKETPIILIDDLYSELDEDREKKIIDLLDEKGQIFITSTELKQNKLGPENDKIFYVKNGQIKEQKH